MGIHRGPNIVKGDLVFGYDTGYGVADNNNTTRFYPGETTENLIYDMGGTVTSAYPEVVYRSTATETNVIDTSAPGGKYSRFTGIDGSSNNQLYSRFSSYSIDVRGDSVNYSVYLKGSGTCHLTIYDNNSGYGTSPTITLTSDWVRYNYTRTVSASATSYWVAVRGVLNTTDVYVAGQQATRGTHATPYVENNRSSTESLIDLKRTTDIDVSNVSFDSTGQPEFDGTDDYIYPNNITNGSGLTSITAEFVVKASANNKNIIKSNSNAILLHYGGAGFYLNSTDGTTSGYLGWNGKLAGGTGVYEHLVATYDGTTMKLYVNGEPTGTTRAYSAGATVGLKDLNNVVIGGNFNSTQPYFNGDIPVAKIHNRALSATEIKQNFNAYKNRFNI